MIKKRVTSLAIVIALVVSVPTAVAIAQDAEECMPSDPPLSVTFIPKQVNNAYFDAAATGATKAAGELCGEFNQIGPSDAKADLQVPFIQDATTQQVSAIAISAAGPDAIAPALQDAMSRGIKVVGYDSTPAVGAYDVFVNQVDFSGVGVLLAEWACELAPDCAGEIAVLSAAATASNQNAWIELMQETLATDERFANLELVDVVYGDDQPQESTLQAQGLLQTYPDLKVIVAPTTVGVLAAAQVVKQEGADTVKVTGLGFPNEMREFVKDGTALAMSVQAVPEIGYWTIR